MDTRGRVIDVPVRVRHPFVTAPCPVNPQFRKAVTDASRQTPAEIPVGLSVCSTILGTFPAAVDPGAARTLTPVRLELVAAARAGGPAGGGPAGLARVITAGAGRCVMIGTHVLREGWGTLGGDCRVAGRQLSAGRHV